MISTRDLSELPDVDGLRRLLKSLAMLDAILCRDWQFRYYSFNSKWAKGERMGSMRDGSGNEFYALFNRHGCYLKGFHHESAMSPYRKGGDGKLWAGLIESVPSEFTEAVTEPAFSTKDTTFCIWRKQTDPAWQRGAIQFPPGHDPDGSAELLAILDGRPETYQAWAADGFEAPSLTVEQVRHIYEHRPLTPELVEAMRYDNPMASDAGSKVTLADLAEDVIEIGYPDAG
ncbi:hypothetical protein [Limnoglobus roseus]|uniref:Uncharacterized protein n=1 Tax=Limnoglobus roseus TaxID=2598579 RepID=A0A5C1AGQ5_9BACT|nr:hypothetical protein [Limnoglobus roseus]QEL17337.1 hypothetical protein PX52LOC_04320 [Limnoglobus roseus]